MEPADVESDRVGATEIYRQLPRVLVVSMLVAEDQPDFPDLVTVGVEAGGLGVNESEACHQGPPGM